MAPRSYRAGAICFYRPMLSAVDNVLIELNIESDRFDIPSKSFLQFDEAADFSRTNVNNRPNVKTLN